jgi:hypothetical protein
VRGLAALLLVLACCKSAAEERRRFKATVVHPPRDTIRFTSPAKAQSCDDRGSLLLEAVSIEGNGMLVRVRWGSTRDSSAYPVITPSDVSTVRGATVAVRYMIRQVSHTFALDSGAVSLRQSGRTLSAHIEGWGFDNAVRTTAAADYADVPLEDDVVPCRSQP